jgi:peptide/nickel transport system permease protein
MLGMVILLSIFGGSILTYRAVFLQVKESPYIEAARAYGASNTRVIFQYLIPRMIPLLIPQLVVLVPSYVFLEASLAVLGLGDPTLPTWGKVINDAYSNGALYQGFYYWVLQPAVLLMITGLAFALVGFSLDRIFNPRLRGL